MHFSETGEYVWKREKITLVDDDQTPGIPMLWRDKIKRGKLSSVTDAEDDEEGDCYILKDMSGSRRV